MVAGCGQPGKTAAGLGLRRPSSVAPGAPPSLQSPVISPLQGLACSLISKHEEAQATTPPPDSTETSRNTEADVWMGGGQGGQVFWVIPQQQGHLCRSPFPQELRAQSPVLAFSSHPRARGRALRNCAEAQRQLWAGRGEAGRQPLHRQKGAFPSPGRRPRDELGSRQPSPAGRCCCPAGCSRPGSRPPLRCQLLL